MGDVELNDWLNERIYISKKVGKCSLKNKRK
jgi:hypothetical protein